MPEPIQFPPNCSPKVREAVAKLLALVRAGFTGKFRLNLKDGIPLVGEDTNTYRFGEHRKNKRSP